MLTWILSSRYLSRELLVCSLTLENSSRHSSEWRKKRCSSESKSLCKYYWSALSAIAEFNEGAEEGRGGICRYCSCSFLSICRSKTSVSVHSHSLIKNGSSPRIAGARERLCTRALTIGTDTRLMLTRPFLIRNCLANSRHPRSEIIEFSYDMVTSHSSIT